MHFTTKQSKS